MTPLNLALAGALLTLGAHGAVHAAPFKACEDAASHPALAGSLCAVERVPGDPSGLSGAPAGEVSLFVRKFPAQGKRRGQVWLIAGGPSESGASFYGQLATLRQAFRGFDLLVPDHRGTGFSTRMCPDEEAPGSPGGTALEGAEWGSCFARLHAKPAYARQFTATNAAHDLALLIERTPGRGKTWLYGVSYGTQLVLRTLALEGGKAGTTVDGVVLDSLVPRQADATADLSRRSLVTDAVGRAWLARCDADPQCSRQLGEPAETVYRRMLTKLEEDGALREAIPGKNPRRFFGSMLDVPVAAAMLPPVARDLAEGRRDSLDRAIRAMEAAASKLPAFPQSPISIPLVMMISASENNLQPERSKEDVKAEEAGLLFSSPLPGMLVAPDVPTYARDKLFDALPRRLPPTLVLQAALDTKTPYEAAMRHVEAVRHLAALRKEGPMAVTRVEHGAHFVLWSMPACFTQAVGGFVRTRAAPAVCAIRQPAFSSN